MTKQLLKLANKFEYKYGFVSLAETQAWNTSLSLDANRANLDKIYLGLRGWIDRAYDLYLTKINITKPYINRKTEFPEYMIMYKPLGNNPDAKKIMNNELVLLKKLTGLALQGYNLLQNHNQELFAALQPTKPNIKQEWTDFLELLTPIYEDSRQSIASYTAALSK
jgi:hypothetical protein